jgi:eukaryotic-like serine/threonine-protein kinase
MALGPRARLGPYEIVAAIGAGGMGEVYRAIDTNLGRNVAIKVLPDAFAQDRERVARFEREAKTLASLNHPNIAIIHGLEKSQGTYALVMELVEGEDLSQRIARGAISIDEALPIAKQVAEALEAAHEQGVIHRDLKPANIKLMPNGTVKVLDFGLAKAMDPVGNVASSVSLSPTITTPAMTQLGVILGTAAYMAPEQAKGKPADKRSDIWAFGCVLFEMFTGQRPFVGDDATDVLVAVMSKQAVDLSALPGDVPPVIRTLLRRCLEKDRKRRLESIADARLEIEDALAAPSIDAPSSVTTPPQRRVAAMAIQSAVVGALIAGAIVWAFLRPVPPPTEPVTRLLLATSSTLPLTPFGFDRDVTVSPDGSFLVYRAGGQGQLAVRRFDRLDAVPVDVSNARQPFVSPDSRWIGYIDEETFEVKKVAVSGGSPITLTRLPLSPRGATWADDATIIVATSNPAVGLLRIPAKGGEPATLTTPDRAHGQLGHWWPSMLPGGHAVLFTIAADTPEKSQIAVLDLDTGQHSTILRGGSHAQYVASGHLLYAAGRALYAAPFDLTRRAVVGEPVRVVEGASVSSLGAANAAITQAGTLAYVPNETGQVTPRLLVWVDRQGRETPIAAPARAYVGARISPDGTRVLVNTYDEESDIWVWDLARQTLTRLTFDPSIDLSPIWTPDGRRVLFSSNRAGAYNPYVRAADGTGVDERIVASDDATYPSWVSADQMSVIGYALGPRTGYDLVRFSLGRAAASQTAKPATPESLLATTATEFGDELSPDGHFVAYASNESGRFEIYVRPYPQLSNGRWQVSTSGGRMPAWNRNGKELVYLDGSGRLTSVAVETTDTFRAGAPMTLVKNLYSTPDMFRSYDISPDGQRFVMVKEGTGGATAPRSVIVVQHFDEELKRLVPVK